MKKGWLVLIILSVLFLIAYLGINAYSQYRLKKFLEDKLSENYTYSWDGLDMNILGGNARIKGLKLNSRANAENDSLSLAIQNLKISGIKLLDLARKKGIHINLVELESPKYKLYKRKPHPKVHNDTTSAKSRSLPISVAHFNLKNGEVFISNPAGKELHVQNITIEVADFKKDSFTEKERIPFKYHLIEAKSDTLFALVGKFQHIQVDKIHLDSTNASFEGFRLGMNYGKIEYQKYLEVEKDWIELSMPKLAINGYKMAELDGKLLVEVKEILMNQIQATIYRNKTPPDPYKYKPLYSRMLREINAYVAVDSLAISDSNLVFQEHQSLEGIPGYITFDDLNMAISHVDNRPTATSRTHIVGNAKFMNHAPTAINWTFNIRDPNDNFELHGSMQNLDWSLVNQFTIPNAHLELSGHLDRMVFQLRGDDDGSLNDLEASYRDFKLTLLSKDGHKEKHLLSSLINVFVKERKNTFNRATKEYYVQRDKTKGFFNLFYLSVRKGLL